MALTGREKATILLSLLGSDLSAQILKSLPEEYSDLITSGINNLPVPSAELIKSVLEEFTSFMSLPGASPKRAIEQPQGTVAVSEAPRQTPPAQRGPYDILFYSQPRKVAVALSAERSSVAAYVLSILPPVQAKEVLASMPERRKELEAIIRAIKKPAVSEQIKERIVRILSERLERLSD